MSSQARLPQSDELGPDYAALYERERKIRADLERALHHIWPRIHYELDRLADRDDREAVRIIRRHAE